MKKSKYLIACRCPSVRSNTMIYPLPKTQRNRNALYKGFIGVGRGLFQYERDLID
jgi:hypothetical protein